jgi:hypothetical protein
VFEVMKKAGGTLSVFTGYNHINDFAGILDGIMPGKC